MLRVRGKQTRLGIKLGNVVDSRNRITTSRLTHIAVYPTSAGHSEYMIGNHNST